MIESMIGPISKSNHATPRLVARACSDMRGEDYILHALKRVIEG